MTFHAGPDAAESDFGAVQPASPITPSSGPGLLARLENDLPQSEAVNIGLARQIGGQVLIAC